MIHAWLPNNTKTNTPIPNWDYDNNTKTPTITKTITNTPLVLSSDVSEETTTSTSTSYPYSSYYSNFTTSYTSSPDVSKETTTSTSISYSYSSYYSNFTTSYTPSSDVSKETATPTPTATSTNTITPTITDTPCTNPCGKGCCTDLERPYCANENLVKCCKNGDVWAGGQCCPFDKATTDHKICCNDDESLINDNTCCPTKNVFNGICCPNGKDENGCLATPTPTDTPLPPTNTPVPPTDTPLPPTNTLVPPTDTPLPPTNTPTPCPGNQKNCNGNCCDGDCYNNKSKCCAKGNVVARDEKGNQICIKTSACQEGCCDGSESEYVSGGYTHCCPKNSDDSSNLYQGSTCLGCPKDTGYTQITVNVRVHNDGLCRPHFLCCKKYNKVATINCGGYLYTIYNCND